MGWKATCCWQFAEHCIKIFCVYWVLPNSKLTTHKAMESVSLLKVIKLLLDAEHVFNLLLSPSRSLFCWLHCNLCNSLLCRTLAFLNTKKFATFLSFSSVTFTGVYCSFYCRFWLQLDFSKFLWIPTGASLCSQESWSDPMKTLPVISNRIVRIATPVQRASLCFFSEGLLSPAAHEPSPPTFPLLQAPLPAPSGKVFLSLSFPCS